MVTDNRFTGQKEDGSGLMYYGARYYDPQIGLFVSPDTLVPDAGLVSDYNRSMYTRGNPLKYNDPSGHCVFGIDTAVCIYAAVAAVAAGSALIVSSDTANHHEPTQAEINSSRLGGGLILAGVGGLTGVYAITGSAIGGACRNDGDCTNEIVNVSQKAQLVQQYANRAQQVRETLNVGASRNVAIADYNINGISGELAGVSGQAVRQGAASAPTTRFFETFAVNHSRDFDSEVKVLEHIAHQFASSPGIYKDVRGALTLFSELPICASCAGVIQQFQQMFPNVVVNVVSGQ